jgi:hypothetical protein
MIEIRKIITTRETVFSELGVEGIAPASNRSQILDELTGERVADHRHPHSPRDWPSCLGEGLICQIW